VPLMFPDLTVSDVSLAELQGDYSQKFVQSDIRRITDAIQSGKRFKFQHSSFQNSTRFKIQHKCVIHKHCEAVASQDELFASTQTGTGNWRT
jgi:hypothetical protein